MKQTHVFPNGFRMIYEKPTNSLQMTVVYAYCDIGSVFEKDGIRGVSHFLEHMCFKGTRKMKNPRDIFLSYDKIGAYFNAFTEKRTTCFTIKCEDNYIENCTDILGEMILHSTIPKSLFQKEQKVVLEENFRNENNMRNVLGEKIDAILYKGSSYEYPIDTLAYHIKNNKKTDIDYKDVVKWYDSFYIPSNIVFSIVSNISFENIKTMLTHSVFTKKKTKLVSFFNKEMNLSLSVPNNNIISIEKQGASTHVIYIGFRTCSHTSKDRFAFKVLKHILNGMSGRLFTILREKHGLTYSSICSTEYFEHTGSFLVNTETSPIYTIPSKKENGVLYLLIMMFLSLKKKGITPEELRVAKGNIRGNYILKTEINDTIAAYNGKEYLLSNSNDFVSYKQYYERNIETVSIDEINMAIRRYFTVENMVIGIIGKDPPTKEKIQKVSKYFY
jgi:predicted Zn-dependent peptidase